MIIIDNIMTAHASIRHAQRLGAYISRYISVAETVKRVNYRHQLHELI